MLQSQKIKDFFGGVRGVFSAPAFAHFWGLVLAITVGNGATLDRLAKLLRGSTHRTKHGEFLHKSDWNESWVVRAIALDSLKRLNRKGGGPCYLILDETQTLKRAKKMSAVSKLFHHATGKYGTGHTMLKVCLYYRGVTIPWASWLWVSKDNAKKEGLDFAKLTELAASAIGNANLPSQLHVTVLFDAYYLCDVVAKACRTRGWHYIGVAKGNRNLTIGGTKHKLAKFGRNVLKRSGRWHRIRGLRRSGMYQLAERVGWMKKLGEVKVVFSRRRGESKTVALVTDDLGAPAIRVVGDYLRRWAVELWIKDEKQHLGLGDYRVLRYRAVRRHLALVDVAYACLTHLGLRDPRAQGQRKNNKVLRLASISQLKARMRQAVWQEAVEDVIKHAHEKPVLRRLEKLLATG
jgi:SRSO17 transposase